MNVTTLIEQLRARPEEERVAIAGGAAGAVGLVLFLVWALSFFFSGVPAVADETQSAGPANAQQAAVVESFEQIRNELRATSVEFETQYEQIKRALEQGTPEDTSLPSAQPAVELSLGDDGEVVVEEVLLKQDILNEDTR